MQFMVRCRFCVNRTSVAFDYAGRAKSEALLDVATEARSVGWFCSDDCAIALCPRCHKLRTPPAPPAPTRRVTIAAAGELTRAGRLRAWRAA